MIACEKKSSTSPDDNPNNPTIQGNFIDLGLNSGTKWKSQNEHNTRYSENDLYTYDEAVNDFKNNLPTKEQWQELISTCTWKWTGKGYRVTGKNGNSIVLPAAGYVSCGGWIPSEVGEEGAYWSSTPLGASAAWTTEFCSDEIYEDSYIARCAGLSVRLVRK